jgi:hypothetical protein
MKKGYYPALNKVSGKVELFGAYESIPKTGYMKQHSKSIELKSTQSDKKSENTMVMCMCTLGDFQNIKESGEYCFHRSAEPKGGKTGSIKGLVWIDGSNEKHGKVLYAEADYYRIFKEDSVDTDVWDSANAYKSGEAWSWVVTPKAGTIKEYSPKEFVSQFGVPYEKLPRVTGGIGYINLKPKK